MEKSDYNQVANYVYLDTNININIGTRGPDEYFSEALEQACGGNTAVGTINNEADFWNSLEVNCIPKDIVNMTVEDYPLFLTERRKLMAKKIRDYYCSL